MSSRSLTLIRGDSRNIDVTIKDADGAAIDITGGTVFFTVNASDDPSDDTAAVITKDVTSHTDAANGLSRIALTASDTEVDAGEYYYDIQYVDSGGNVSSREKGELVVESDITRRTS